MGYITFVDENLYIKKEKALRRYFKKAHKDLLFNVIPKLKDSGKKDGLYERKLITEPLFEKVYGPMMLKFSVKNDVAIIENIEPNEILLACYFYDLPTYHGIPYETKKDLSKLKIMEGILCQKKKSKTTD